MWLKSLRLHKYSHIFTDITYEQMLTLTEDYLDSKDVTKGARNKILLCIQKIKERKSLLLQLEKVLCELYIYIIHFIFNIFKKNWNSVSVSVLLSNEQKVFHISIHKSFVFHNL